MAQVASAIAALTAQAREVERVRSELSATRDAAHQLAARATLLQRLATESDRDAAAAPAAVRTDVAASSAASAAVVAELDAARARIAAMETAAAAAHEAAAAAARSAQEQVAAAMAEAQARGQGALESLIALVNELSTSHAEEVARLNANIVAHRERAAALEGELSRVVLLADARVAQAQAAHLEGARVEAERVRAEVVAATQAQIAAANERADKASSRLRGLREELMRMANDADRRIAEETTKREAAERRLRRLEGALETSTATAAEHARRVDELTAALKLSADALRAAEGRAAAVAGVVGAGASAEAAALRSVLDRTAASLRGRARGHSVSSDGVAASSHAAAPSTSGGVDTVPPVSTPSRTAPLSLDDSLASAARLSDVTQRLSAYVRSGVRASYVPPGTGGGKAGGGDGAGHDRGGQVP